VPVRVAEQAKPQMLDRVVPVGLCRDSWLGAVKAPPECVNLVFRHCSA